MITLLLIILAMILVVAVDIAAWIQACWVASLFTRNDDWTRSVRLYSKTRNFLVRYAFLATCAVLVFLGDSAPEPEKTNFLAGICVLVTAYFGIAAWSFRRDLTKFLPELR